jgi:mycothiol synthase
VTITPSQAGQVLSLAARAAAADGVEPLNEEARFALRDGSGEHHLAFEDGELLGYLHWQPAFGTAQLVVDPGHRRQGHGRALLGQLPPEAGVWAFGDLESARGFAAALGLRPRRELLVMARPLADATPPPAPGGVVLRGYEPRDADALLALNAAAFAHHPEQGALDAAGLAARTAEAWFDPAGLILAEDGAGLLGFHWTKRQDAATGEVYVIGVHPRGQGRGLGRLLLDAGLAHLAAAGCRRVLLYVDSAETIAVEMYASGGFDVVHRDVLYAPPGEETR